MKKLNRKSNTLNPLDFIDRSSPDALDDCRDLAEMLVIKTGEEKEPHWNEAAEMWIAATIAAVVFYGKPDDEIASRSL